MQLARTEHIRGTFASLLLLLPLLLQAGAPRDASGGPSLTEARGTDRSGLLVPDWTAVPYDPFPLAPAVLDNPVLVRLDVHEGNEYAHVVADPFLFHEDGSWYMFFEAWIHRGKIGLATSSDGLDWTFDRLVLIEEWHQSYPMVFRFEGDYYMIPESSAIEEVRLYKASDFPYAWEYEATLISGRELLDPSLFRVGETWWMFLGGENNESCYLYYSSDLATGWTEHPMSPIVEGDAGRARPGGRPLVLEDGRVIRFAQKCDLSYGEAVRAFEVEVLTETDYQEREVEESPVLRASGSGWNAGGMHQCDAWWTGEYWLAAVDGWSEELSWSIGIYRTAAVGGLEDRETEPASGGETATRIVPNPFRGGTRIAYELPEGLPIGEAVLEIFDATGRLVRALRAVGGGAGRVEVFWNGEDEEGRDVPDGVYFCRTRGTGQRRGRRMVILR